MGKHDGPDADGLEALADKVNEIFRPLVADIFPPPDPVPGLAQRIPQPSPLALEVYDKVLRVADGDETLGESAIVLLSLRDAASVLELVVGGALAHQAEDHPEQSWIECESWARAVYIAAHMFAVLGQGKVSR